MATDQATIQKMQQDLIRFRANKLGLSAPADSAASAAPVAPATPIAPTGATGSAGPDIGADLATYRSQRDSGTLVPKIPKDDPNALAKLAKGIFSPVATLVARPIQAGAELFGASADTVDKATNSIESGLGSVLGHIPLVGKTLNDTVKGIVAPVPRNAGDVEKDVGRGAETIALGTGAPIAGGALFGAGASLEQGNNLLSTQTLLNTALGAGSGKLLEWIGKPLLNAAGKVVGTITPKVLQDVVSGGAEAVAKFAATHDLPFNISSVTKPLSESIEKGAQAIDEKIGTGASKAVSGLKNTITDQYPGLNPVKHFQDVNARDIAQPTTVNSPAYRKATAVFNDAKSRGIDLSSVANDRGIIHDQIAEGGKYNTKDTADALREDNFKMSNTLARPAIRAADTGVENIPVSQVKGAMLKKIHDTPSLDPEERATMLKQIEKRYAPGSAADLQHPNGYSLEELHNSRIISANRGKYKLGQSPSAEIGASRFRKEGQVFADLFDRNVPEAAGLKGFRKELEKNFMLADYLDELNSKKVPEGITKKAVKLFGRALGGTLGGNVAGFPGVLAGSHFGNILFGGFETLPNPIKMKVLQSIVQTEPAAFQALRSYISDEELQRLLRQALPAAGKSSYKEVAPILFATPKGSVTPIKQEALDAHAVESGNAKVPKDGRTRAQKQKLIDFVQQNSEGPYVPADQLPVIQAGKPRKSPKRLNDIL
jgi:hypothetical protein